MNPPSDAWQRKFYPRCRTFNLFEGQRDVINRKKTILITGATAGIGLETAKALVAQGHDVLVHGRSRDKTAALSDSLRILANGQKNTVQGFVADMSSMADVAALATNVRNKFSIDVLINNAGVFKTSQPVLTTGPEVGLDARFVVNVLAPMLLTQELHTAFNPAARVVNLSSAAQAPVMLDALIGRQRLADFDAYAQSKLALTMWSCHRGRKARRTAGSTGPVFVAVNPASMLGTNMVRQGFGVAGKDVQIGANIVTRAALADDFSDAYGAYFDNDVGTFVDPHPDALDDLKCQELVDVAQKVIDGNINLGKSGRFSSGELRRRRV